MVSPYLEVVGEELSMLRIEVVKQYYVLMIVPIPPLTHWFAVEVWISLTDVLGFTTSTWSTYPDVV